MESIAADEPDHRYRWYVLCVLTLVYTVHYIDRSVINAVLEPIKVEFALSDAALGLLVGPVYAVAYALAGLPLGLLIDRTNRVRLLAALLATWSALTFMSGLAPSFAVLVAARAAVGAAEAGGSPTALSIIADYFPPRRRATASGIFFLSVTAGIFTGYLMSGMVAAHAGWRMAFFVAGVPGLLLALILLTTVREPPRGRLDDSQTSQTPSSLRQTFIVLLSEAKVRWTLLGIVVAATVTSGFNAFVISLLVRRFGLDLGTAALAVSVCIGLFGGGGAVLWGAYADRLGLRGAHRPPLLIAWTSVAATVLGIAGVLASSLPLAIVGIAGYAFCIASFMGSGYGLLLNFSPPAMRGSCVAVAMVIINLIGTSFGPLVVGGLSTALAPSFGGDGLAPALVLVVSLTLLAAVCHGAVARSIKYSRGRTADMERSNAPQPGA